MTWEILLTEIAQSMLMAITDRRLRGKIKDRIDGLSKEPEKQGKVLLGELSGYRSLRAAGQRYRIIYRLEKQTVVILVVAIGLRKDGSKKDVYALAKKLLQLGLIEGKS